MNTLIKNNDYDIILNESKKILKYMKLNYERFPYGFCSKVSFLLSYTLKNYYGLDTIIIISGSLKGKPLQTHAWVFANGFYVDLTLNQFNELLGMNNPEVFISNNSVLHNKLFDYDGLLDIPCKDDNFDNLVKNYYSFYEYKKPDKILIEENQDLGD